MAPCSKGRLQHLAQRQISSAILANERRAEATLPVTVTKFPRGEIAPNEISPPRRTDAASQVVR